LPLAEYRLDELARTSGVSARNIRAYRERGLLDPPRRVGRSAYYDDYHLSQLRTINQLLRRGFNSAHIAEFFASMRQGVDLADILGIQRALLGPRNDGVATEAVDGDGSRPSDGKSAAPPERALDIDPSSGEAERLIDYGLAELRDGRVVVLDPAIGDILGRTSEKLLYARALMRIHEATRDIVDELARVFVQTLDESVEARFGKDHMPETGEIDELAQIAQDYRDLWDRVVFGQIDTSLQRLMSTAASNYPAGVPLSEILEQ
jgi:DNA-binding transcriptional MerR regulator